MRWQDAPAVGEAATTGTQQPRWMSAPEQRKSARQQYEEIGYTAVVARANDGYILRNPETGEQVYTSPGYNTSDPVEVAKLLEGATPAETFFDDTTIAARPIASRAAKAFEGTPFIGTYGDEIAGALYGDHARDAWRQASGAMDREKPIESTGLQIGGGLLSAIPALMAAGPSMAANSLSGNMVRGAGLGLLEGLTRGFGRGEDGAQDRFETAAVDGGIGAAVGGALPVAAHGVGALWRLGRNAVNEMRGIGRVAKDLDIDRGTARLLSDTLNLDDPARMRDALAQGGADAMLADAGPTAQGALDVAIQSPGEGARTAINRIDNRASRAGQRLTDVLDQTLTDTSVGNQSSRQFSDTARMQGDIRQATAPTRKAVYDRAYEQPIDYSSPQGTALLNRITPRIPQEAIGYANKLMRLRGEKSQQIMANIADDGTVTFTNPPDVRQWDYIKQALDGLAESGDGAGALGGQTRLGAGYQGLAREIRGTLGEAVPEYDYAVNTAGDIIGEIQALKAGENLLRPGVTRAEAEAALDGMTDASKRAVKRGLRQNIDDTLANVKAVATDQNVDIRETYKAYTSLSSRASRDKMQMLLGDDWPSLERALDDAASALGLRARVATNSRTFGRQQFDQMLDESTDPGAIRRGEPLGTARDVWQRFTRSTPDQVRRARAGIRDELADVLTRPEATGLLDAIEAARSAYPALPSAGQGLLNAIMALGASTSPTSGSELRKQLFRQ